MGWVLLLVAISGPPAQLGTYATESACTDAIRTIFQTQYNLSNSQAPQLQVLLNKLIDTQREYRCVATKKD